MIVDRETSKGRLTGEMNGTQLALRLDGKTVAVGTPRDLPRKLRRQLPDEFTHIVKNCPLTASEVEAYEAAKPETETDADRARMKIKYRIEEIERELENTIGGPKEAKLRRELSDLEAKL